MSDWGRGRQDGGGGGGGGGSGGGFSRGGPSVEMEVSCRDVPRIIGRGGSKIRQLQDDSGCRINIRKDTDNGVTTVVELQGDSGAQQRAKNLIEDFLAAAESYGGGGGSDRGYSDRGRNGGGGGFYDRRGGGGGYSDRRGGGGGGYDRRGGGGGGSYEDRGDAFEMEISSRDVGRVIGKGGSKIRELQEESGARIKIRKDKDNGVTTAIELQGSAEAQQRAKELIEEFVSTDGRDNYNNYNKW